MLNVQCITHGFDENIPINVSECSLNLLSFVWFYIAKGVGVAHEEEIVKGKSLRPGFLQQDFSTILFDLLEDSSQLASVLSVIRSVCL